MTEIKNTSSVKVAYFSMEISIRDEMKTYCGGLGILAGDILSSAADLDSPIIGITLLYKNGWFKQDLDPKFGQVVSPDTWDWQKYLVNTNLRFNIKIADEEAVVEIWKYFIKGSGKNGVWIYFLNTDLAENSTLIRSLSNSIYSQNKDIWLRQEILLGLGGLKAVEVLGYNDIEVYHLNESHAMSLVLGLGKKYGNSEEVKKRLCFTTHTPLQAAHQTMHRSELETLLEKSYIDWLDSSLWEGDILNFTEVCSWYAKYTNAVAKRHQATMKEMYPDLPVDYITNGIHHRTWLNPYLQTLFTKYIDSWQSHPSFLRLIDKVPDSDILNAHDLAKSDLIADVNRHVDIPFKKDIFTLGFARRAVPYKRANLVFSQMERLREIAKKSGGIQIVFAGKSHPGDDSSNSVIKEILNFKNDDEVNIVYLPNYSINLAKKIVSGVDVWLNNPIPPLEASGTSGMKAAINGVPQFSILDGWWPEGHIEGVTGWSIGQDLCEGDMCKLIEIEDLYFKLEHEILPKYKNKSDWTKIMKSCISLNGSYFHTHRVLEEYFCRGYFGKQYE